MKDKYIAVACGTAWELKSEPQGWIFRQMTDHQYGFSGHHRTAGDAIRSLLMDGAILVKTDGIRSFALDKSDASQIH